MTWLSDGIRTLLGPPEMSSPTPLSFSTLTGLVDYLEGKDTVPGDLPMVHIASPTHVVVMSEALRGPDNRRYTYAQAKANLTPFQFGHYQDNEVFIINVLSQFVQDANTNLLTSALGNLASTSVAEHKDDGFAQSLEVRSGILQKEGIVIENPICLRPYRTFLEVEQPASNCLYRHRKRKGDESNLDCVLFETDGGMWELEAIQNIKAWLGAELPTVRVLA